MSTRPARQLPRRGGALRLAAVSAAVLLAGLVAAVWVVPGALDWSRFRGSIAALVSAGIGRPVVINGSISLHLLPQPILVASDLQVEDAGDGLVMQAHQLRLRVALGPLLGGRVDARELTLRGADLRLPWPPPPGAVGRRPPAWLTGLQARVEESRLQAGGFVVSDINASLGSDPDTGTLSAAGTARMLSLPWHVTARLGRPGRDGAAPLDASVDGQDKLRDTGGTFSGTLAEDGGLSGRLAARGPDLAALVPAPAVAWRADGRLSAAGGIAIADELDLDIGGAPARGAVALRVQPDLRLDFALNTGRLDLDAWLPVLLREARGPAAAGGRASLPTGIDLSAEAASFAGGTLRRLRCGVEVDGAGLSLRDGSVLLPGDAKLVLQGRFPRGGRVPSFEGNGQLTAPDLRGTLRWLEPFAPALLSRIPAGALRTGDLAAKVTVDQGQFSFNDLQGRLDGSRTQGGLVLRLGARPSVSTGLTLDRVLLDPWLPEAEALAQPAHAFRALGDAVAHAGFDADIKLQSKTAAWRGLDFGPFSLDAQTEGARLTVRRLEATAYGVHAAGSGTLGENERVSEARLEVTTQDVAAVRPLLPAELTPALLHGPAALVLQASGAPEALALRAQAEMGDLRLEAQPTFNLQAGRWAGSVTIRHPGAPRLLEALGLNGTAAWLGDGSFSLIAQANARPGRLELSHMDVIAGGLRASAQLALEGSAVSGTVDADTLPLPSIFPRSPEPLPLGVFGATVGTVHVDAAHVLVDGAEVLQRLSGDLGWSKDEAGFDNAAGTLSGGLVAGAVKVSGGERPAVALDAHLNDVAITGPVFGGTLDVTAGLLKGQVSLRGEGYSPAALAATLSGSGSLEVGAATVTGIDLRAAQQALSAPAAPRPQVEQALRQALAGGTTAFKRLAAPFQVARGVLSMNVAGTAESGGGGLVGTVDLLGGTFEGTLTLQPAPPQGAADSAWPEVTARVSGPAAAPARTPELAPVARWLAEQPDARP